MVCEAALSEREAYSISSQKNIDANRHGSLIHDRRLIISYNYRHSDCLSKSYLFAVPNRPSIAAKRADAQLKLSILRISRQCHDEIFPILWGMNVFSFSKAKTLAQFTDERSTTQKLAIRRLNLHPEQPLRVRKDIVDNPIPGEDTKWANNIPKLQNLEMVHLWCRVNFTEENLSTWWLRAVVDQGSLQLIHVLQQFSLRDVKVHVTEADDDESNHAYINLNLDQRQELSRFLEARICGRHEQPVLSTEEAGRRQEEWQSALDTKYARP